MTYVALLRGINVGGKHRVPMKELAEIFTRVGCTGVRTYIQSGNVLFSAPPALVKGLPGRVQAEIVERFGFAVPVILRSFEELAGVADRNPFLVAGVPEKELHVYFLAEVPNQEAMRKLDPSRFKPDTFCISGRDVYVHLPNGMARTKLTNAYFDAKLSTTSTARNWATVLKLLEMMAG